MSFWHTATPNSGNEYGWVGRTAAAPQSGGRAREPNRQRGRQPVAGGEGGGASPSCSATRRAPARPRAEEGGNGCARRPGPAIGDAHKYMLEVTRSAAQASEVMRAALSHYTDNGRSGSRLLDLDRVVALIEAAFRLGCSTYFFAAVFSTPASTRRRRTSDNCNFCSDHRRLLQEMRRIGRADDVVVSWTANSAAACPEHEPWHRPRHRTGQLRHRRHRRRRALWRGAEPRGARPGGNLATRRTSGVYTPR